MSSQDTGRNPSFQRGNPASDGNNSRRDKNPGTRSQRRAFEHQQNKVFDDNWAEAKQFEERPVKPRGQTARSANWKGKQQEKRKERKDDAAISYDFRAKEETAPVDEPLYDLGPHSSSIPVQETYSQNFDFSGYVDQVEKKKKKGCSRPEIRYFCKYTDGYCIDANEGYITWTNVKAESCSRTSYQVLYRGYVSKVYVQSEVRKEDAYTLYSIKDDRFLATLLYKEEKKICGIPTIITDHPKLLIQEIKNGMTYFEQSRIEPNNMDIFLYVNAKFTHLDQHMRRELSRMYEIIVKDQCETKKQLLKTQLSLASIDPVEFAYVFTGKPGYTGVTIGEQVHVIQCKPVHVSSAKVEGCFNEMPVSYSLYHVYGT